MAIDLENIDFTKTLFNVEWRLQNLYKIRYKSGKLGLMKLNETQMALLKEKHPRILVLKTRQKGVSTFKVISALDSCIWIPGYQAGIQSYGKIESKKLQAKAVLAWEELDNDIKQALGIKLLKNNADGMEFSNGSVFRVGNFRGDTLSELHVSEMAKISSKYPDKAIELKTGAFEAVSKDNKISIETTSEGDVGLFPEMWYKATELISSGEPLTPLDFKPLFFTYLDDKDCRLEHFQKTSKQVIEYFQKVSKLSEVNITTEREDITDIVNPNYTKTLHFNEPTLNWTIAKLRALGNDFDREYPLTPEIAFSRPIDGTYFRHEYERLIEEERIGEYPYTPGVPVTVSFDLGVNDHMVLIFEQTIDNIPYIINEYSNSYKGLAHYASIMTSLSEELGYEYGDIIFPHDGTVFEMTGNMTRLSTMHRLGYPQTRVLDYKLGFTESINVCRSFLDVVRINKDTCPNTISAIQQYRKKFDAKLNMFTGEDVHDIHSNYAASLRYLGQGLGFSINPAYIEDEVPDEPFTDYNSGFGV